MAASAYIKLAGHVDAPMVTDSDRQELIDHVRQVIALLQPVVDASSVFPWDGSDGYLPVVRRSILRRQLEALEVAVHLTQIGKADGAVPLLRPACEELLWLRYLNKLSNDVAGQLIDCMLRVGVLSDLEAQAAEVDHETMAAMGLLSYLEGFQRSSPQISERLKDLGKLLNWPKRTVDAGRVPTTWFVAKSTESESLYRFLYHATSRYVHFNVAELSRRGWGRPGRLEVSSRHYEPIWAMFCLSWGTRLLAMTLNESAPIIAPEHSGDSELIQDAFDRVCSAPLIPLVTPDELVWDPKAG